MRKVQRAAAVVAILGSIGLVGVGTASAAPMGIGQGTQCKSHDLNADVLGEVGVLNGVAGNVLSGEGNPGGQATGLGSTAGCNNSL